MNEVYKIAIAVSLLNTASGGLMRLSGQLEQAEMKGDALRASLLKTEIQMKRMSQLVMGGMVAEMAGGMIAHKGIEALKGMIDPAMEYTHQLSVMNVAGMTQLEIADSVGAAWQNTHTIMTTTATENLQSILDLRNILGNMDQAKMALPIVSRIQAAMQASTEGGLRDGAHDIAFSMAKALDIIGAARNPKEFTEQADMMAKAVTAFQGRVTPKMFQSVFQYARQGKFDMSDEFKYEILPTLMLESSAGGKSAGGGSRGVGPMIAAMYRVTNQGYVNKKSYDLWHELGLDGKESALKTTTSGTTMGAVKDAMLASSNPFLYIINDVVPAIKKKFGSDEATIRQVINQLFRGNQLAASLAVEFATKPQNFTRDQALIRKSEGSAAYDSALKNDPVFAQKALHDQWANFTTALGLTFIPIIVPALIKLTNAVSMLSSWARNNPNAAKFLVAFVAGFTALGVVLAVVGGIAMAVGALGLSAGTAAVIGAVTIGLTAFGAAVYAFWPYLRDAYLACKNWAVDMYTAIKGFFSGVLSWIWDYLKKSWFGAGRDLHDKEIIMGGNKAPTPNLSLPLDAMLSIAEISGFKVPAVTDDLPVPDQLDIPHPKTSAVTPAGGFAKAWAPPKPSDTTITVNSNVILDGRKIGNAVTNHIVNQATGPMGGKTTFDPTMQMPVIQQTQ